MNSVLDEAYFNWLTSPSQITTPGLRSYDGLFREMYAKQFAWTVPNDDNRVEDGNQLRHEFLQGDQYRFPFGVSFLEVVVALSRRMAFEVSDAEPGEWAWILLENLELDKYWDPVGFRKKVHINDILETVIWRMYEPDGSGGFFPLQTPNGDQTKVEIWYQMNTWLNQNFPI